MKQLVDKDKLIGKFLDRKYGVCEDKISFGDAIMLIQESAQDAETQAAYEIFRKAVAVYGAEPQVDQALEELSELIKALLKYRRAENGLAATVTSLDKLEELRKDIVEEIGDVEVMLQQLRLIYHIEESEVDSSKNFKTARLASRIDAFVKSQSEGSVDEST